MMVIGPYFRKAENEDDLKDYEEDTGG